MLSRFIILPVVVLVAVLTFVATLCWALIYTAPGSALLLDAVVSRVAGLSVGSIDGIISDGVEARDVRYETASVNVRVNSLRLSVTIPALLEGRLVLDGVESDQVHIVYTSSDAVPDPERSEVNLPLPIQIRLRQATAVTFAANDGEPIEAARLAGEVLLEGGQLTVRGLSLVHALGHITGDTSLSLNPPYRYEGNLVGDKLPGGLLSDISARFEGTAAGIEFSATATPGDVQVRGHLDFSEGLPIQVSASAASLVPGTPEDGLVVDKFTGKVDGSLDNYQFEASATVVTSMLAPIAVKLGGTGSLQQISLASVRLTSTELDLDGSGRYDLQSRALTAAIDGRWFERALSGKAQLADVGRPGMNGSASASVAGNLLSVTVVSNERLDFSANVENATAIHPDLTGTLSARGTFNMVDGSLVASGSSRRFGFREHQFTAMTIEANGRPGDHYEVALKIGDWHLGDVALGHGEASFHGLPSLGDLTLSWQHPDATLDLAAAVAINGSDVTATVTSAQVLSAGTWRTAGVGVSVTAGRVRVDDHCWQQQASKVCLRDLGYRDGAGSGALQADELQLPGFAAQALTANFRSRDTGEISAKLGAGHLAFGDAVALSGVTAQVDGTADEYQFGARATLVTEIGGALELAGSGTGERIVVDALSLTNAESALMLTATAALATSNLKATLGGNLYGYPVEGQVDVTGTAVAAMSGLGEVSIAGNQLTLVATDGRVVVALSAEHMQALDPRLSGALNLAGYLILPGGEAVLEGGGEQLRFGDHQLGNLVVSLNSGADGHLDSSVRLTDWRYGIYPIGSGQLAYAGSLSAGTLAADWRTDDLDIDLATALAFTDGEMDGTVTRGKVIFGDQHWEIDPAVGFARSADQFTLGDHCWAHASSKLCAKGVRFDATGAAVGISLSRLVLSVPEIAFAPDVGVNATIDLELNAVMQTSPDGPRYDGSLSVNIPDLDLRYLDDQSLHAGIVVNADIKGRTLTANVSGQSDADALVASLTIPDINRPGEAKGSGNLHTSKLNFVTAFIPQMDRATGSLTADLEIDTVSEKQVLDLSVDVGDNASVVVPAAGITLTNLKLKARSDTKTVNFVGSARSGDGELVIDGVVESPLTAERAVAATVKGKGFTVLQRQEIAVVVSPDMTVNYRGDDSIQIGGSLVVNDGSFRLADLGPQARTVSSDVVVVGQEQPAQAYSNLDLRLNVIVEKFAIDIYGLKSNVTGSVNLIESPGTPRRAVGNVNLIDGSFARFGQSFDVERGRLIFSGPLNNPVVDVVSTRSITESGETIKISLVLSGPANAIRSTITSTPVMSEARALSYLVLGRALSSASAAEGQSLSGAAVALGLKQAAPITDEIRNALGLTELTLANSGVDSTMVIAGKRVTRQLYVEYSYDVFSRIGGILFNYQLTPQLSVETRSGEAKSMQLIYTFK